MNWYGIIDTKMDVIDVSINMSNTFYDNNNNNIIIIIIIIIITVNTHLIKYTMAEWM